ALTWARDRVAGTMGLDDRHLALAHRIWPFLLFGCFAALASRLYLQALKRRDQPGLSRLLAGAVAIPLLAAAAPPPPSRGPLASLAAVLLAFGFCRSCLPPDRAGAAFVFFAWNPLLAWEICGQAHSEGLVLVGMVAFVWAATRGREWLAALALACAVYAKVVL